MTRLVVIAALCGLAIAVTLLRRLWPCPHRYGLPISGHVRCMKCFRRFRIEAESGEWRIARRPAEEA